MNRLIAPAWLCFAAIFVPALSEATLFQQMPDMHPVQIDVSATAPVFINPAEQDLHLISIAENLLDGRDGLLAEIRFGEALGMGRGFRAVISNQAEATSL